MVTTKKLLWNYERYRFQFYAETKENGSAGVQLKLNMHLHTEFC